MLEAKSAVELLEKSESGDLSHKPAAIAICKNIEVLSKAVQLHQLQLLDLSKELRGQIRQSTSNTIDSNKDLARSNKIHSAVMIILTVALAIATAVQAWATHKQVVAIEEQTRLLQSQNEINEIIRSSISE